MSRRALVLLLVARAASADPQTSAQAEALFREGRELVAKGDFARACEAFDSSQQLEPAIATLLNQADCREQNGQLATAWVLFLDAERQAKASTDPSVRDLESVAATHAAALTTRLSTLAIAVAHPVDRLQIRRDGAPLDASAWNHPLPIDGGTHVVTASAPGRIEWKQAVEVGREHDAQSVAVPELALAPVPPPPPPPSRLPYYVGGGALVLLGAAAGLELWSSHTYDRSTVEIDNDRQASLFHDANHERYLAEGVAVLGLACAATAIYLYVRGDRPRAALNASGVAFRW
jgi:hypothetical protein